MGKEGSAEAQSSNYVFCIFLDVELLQRGNVSVRGKMFSPLIFLYHDSNQSLIMIYIYISQVKMLKKAMFPTFSNKIGFGLQNFFK